MGCSLSPDKIARMSALRWDFFRTLSAVRMANAEDMIITGLDAAARETMLADFRPMSFPS